MTGYPYSTNKRELRGCYRVIGMQGWLVLMLVASPRVRRFPPFLRLRFLRLMMMSDPGAGRRAQAGCEMKSYFYVYLRLVYMRHPVFDRIFDCLNVYFRRVQYVQDGIRVTLFFPLKSVRWPKVIPMRLIDVVFMAFKLLGTKQLFRLAFKTCAFSLRIRITTFSPSKLGWWKLESDFVNWGLLILKRPSWGSLCSSALRLDNIFGRAMMPDCAVFPQAHSLCPESHPCDSGQRPLFSSRFDVDIAGVFKKKQRIQARYRRSLTTGRSSAIFSGLVFFRFSFLVLFVSQIIKFGFQGFVILFQAFFDAVGERSGWFLIPNLFFLMNSKISRSSGLVVAIFISLPSLSKSYESMRCRQSSSGDHHQHIFPYYLVFQVDEWHVKIIGSGFI